MVPYSNHINNPQKESKNPRAQSIKDAPTEPTEERIEEGVEKIPVPMIRPTLHENFRHVDQGKDGLKSRHNHGTAEDTQVSAHPPSDI